MPELLELREPDGAFARIEELARGERFFAPGGDGLVADLYLGYGLSEAIRRGIARRRRSRAARSLWPHAGWEATRWRVTRVFAIGEWERSWDAAEYGDAVEDVREAIARGDVYQVNLVQHLGAPFAGDSARPRQDLASLRPLRLRLRHRHVECRVRLAGALPRSAGRPPPDDADQGDAAAGEVAELRASEKDAAEHVMIVDLERNDLSRVCEAGSIRWPELMEIHALAGVEHMVSTVEGTLRPGVGLARSSQRPSPAAP